MELITVFKEPAILIIITIFLFFILFTLRNYYFAQANLKKVYLFLKNFNKKEISYRFTRPMLSQIESNTLTLRTSRIQNRRILQDFSR